MKNYKFLMAWLTIIVFLFASCSKEETGRSTEDQEMIQITFSSLLKDMNTDFNKQAASVECREGDPAYVLVGITDDDGNYIGEDGGTTTVNLIEVGLKWNNAMNVYETEYSEELALPAGNYQVEHFIVYDSGNQVLWVAPRSEGSFEDYVDNPLPQPIILTAGTKPYITIDVLCYESRSEDAYGYVFFDINLTEVENSYCIFVNYCDDETGREYPAYFRVQVWTDGYDGQEELTLSNNTNSITMEEGWPSASVLCFALPPLEQETYYARVTVLNHDDLNYTADATDIHEFEITQAEIEAQQLFIPAYNHVRINCRSSGGDIGCNTDVICRLNLENELPVNCTFTSIAGSNDNEFVRVSNDGELFLLADLGGAELTNLGTVDISLINNEINLTIDTPLEETDRITAYTIEVRRSDGNAMDANCWESYCANVVNEYGSIENSFDGFTYEYPFYVKVSTISCFTPQFLD